MDWGCFLGSCLNGIRLTQIEHKPQRFLWLLEGPTSISLLYKTGHWASLWDSDFLRLRWLFFKIPHKKQFSRSTFKVEFNCCSVFLRDAGVNECSSHSLISSQIPLLRFTASLSNTSKCIISYEQVGYHSNVLLMSYRFSLLPWCFTVHPLHYHQIFSTYWLGLMHHSPWAEFKLLISERKWDGEKTLLIKVVMLANLQAF